MAVLWSIFSDRTLHEETCTPAYKLMEQRRPRATSCHGPWRRWADDILSKSTGAKRAGRIGQPSTTVTQETRVPIPPCVPTVTSRDVSDFLSSLNQNVRNLFLNTTMRSCRLNWTKYHTYFVHEPNQRDTDPVRNDSTRRAQSFMGMGHRDKLNPVSRYVSYRQALADTQWSYRIV